MTKLPALAEGGLQCARCNNQNRRAARFCDACGASVLLAAADRSDYGGELKYVTVLFVDIVNSTGMIADRSPDEARSMLLPVVQTMIEAIEDYGGSVNQRLGDGVMALFGAPISLEDHSARACHAALRMHEAVSSWPVSIQLRVGIASGLTLLSLTDPIANGGYPAFGETIHLASRLQALARPATSLCAESTVALAGPNIIFVPLGAHAVRGFHLERDVFAIQGRDERGRRFERSSARAMSSLVGRDTELTQLSAHSRRAAVGQARSVAIVGEAGAGKSRLAWELASLLLADGWTVIQVEAISHGRDVPYQLVGTLFRSVLGLRPGADPEETLNRLPSLPKSREEGPSLTAALLSLLGARLGWWETAWNQLDPFHRREMLRVGFGFLIEALLVRPRTLLVIEDLHWADDESIRLLNTTHGRSGHWLLLATYRPEFRPTTPLPFDDAIQLDPLSAEALARLVQQAFPALSNLGTAHALIERSGGNPFFLEQLAREAMLGDANQFNSRSIPLTVQAVVAARIDRLAPISKRVLVAASVLGTRFPLRILRSLINETDSILQPCLQNLFETGLIRRAKAYAEELVFTHALIQEVAYGLLPRGQRVMLHSRVVRAFHEATEQQFPDLSETLAYHAALGEEWEELLNAARDAGRRAAGKSAYVEAARFFDHAIDACGKLPSTDAFLASEIDVRFELRSALFPTAGISRSLENSLNAERCATALGERHRLGWATAYVAKDFQLVGRPGAGIEAAARASEMADGDELLSIACRYFSGQAYYSRGEYTLAVDTLRALVAELERTNPGAWAGTPGPSVLFYRAWITWSLARLGHLAEALATAVEMKRLAEEADLPLCRTIAALSEGLVHAFAGRLPEAEAELRESLRLCLEWEFVAWSTNVLSALGHVLSRQGQLDEGIMMLQQACDRTSSSGILVSHANELAWLAEAHLLAGRAEEAESIARMAASVASSHEESANAALAHLVLGQALAARGANDAARVELETAQTLGRRASMKPLVQDCEMVLQRLRAPGKRLVHQLAS